MDQHKTNMSNLCRVCGRKARGYTHNKCSDKCKAILMSVCGIEVEMEDDDIYPKIVCNSCYISLSNRMKAKEKGEVFTSPPIHSWNPHTGSCQVCSGVSSQSAGGRPKKKVLTGRPNFRIL